MYQGTVLVANGLNLRSISCLSCVIVRVKVVFRKNVVGDWRFDYLNGIRRRSQMKSLCQMMVFMPLIVVLIGQFCRDMIGRQDLKLQWLVGCFIVTFDPCIVLVLSYV